MSCAGRRSKSGRSITADPRCYVWTVKDAAWRRGSWSGHHRKVSRWMSRPGKRATSWSLSERNIWILRDTMNKIAEESNDKVTEDAVFPEAIDAMNDLG
eukprot:1472927-Pyramimonas_sp.AAC.1